MNIVKVISTTFKEGLKRIKVLRRGKSDVQTPYESMPFGLDGIAPEGMRALHVHSNKKGKSFIIGYVNLSQLDSLVPGENRIYSTDENGELSIDIILRGNGTMEFGGNDDFLVRYNELETAFNQLKDDFDNHIHSGVIVSVTGGSGSPAVGVGGNTGTPTAGSTADITPSKIAELKTKGI